MPCSRGCCAVDGCDGVANEPGAARGWCSKHYQRWKKYGDPTAGTVRVLPPVERFLAQTVRDGECLVWTGAKDSNGYGLFGLDGVSVGAHRFAYATARGPVPDGLELDHLCRNRACVRLSHLEAVTKYENMRRGESPFAKNLRVTACPQGHEYTDENIWRYRGSRYCRECRRIQARDRKRRIRLEARA